MQVAMDRLFQYLSITSFPSSLAAGGLLLATLLALPQNMATMLASQLRPGAHLLARWLPLFFLPPLISLPITTMRGTFASSREAFLALITLVVGFVFTLYTTASSVVLIRTWQHDRASAPKTTHPYSVGERSTMNNVTSTATTATQVLPFSRPTLNLLLLLISMAAPAAIARSPVQLGAQQVLLILATATSYVGSTRCLPLKLTSIVHPLVWCVATTWTTMVLLCRASSHTSTFSSLLKLYPGKILVTFLGPAVISLAMAIYDRRQLVWDNAWAVTGGVVTATVGGLWGTALWVRWLGLSQVLRRTLLSRNITTPLALAITRILQGHPAVAVSACVVTGLLGANVGAFLLDLSGIQDDGIARGLGMGAAAHGLGTAAMANEKEAFPFSAIGMALVASVSTVLVSIPVVRTTILNLALD